MDEQPWGAPAASHPGLSQRALTMPFSSIRRVFRTVRELKAQNIRVMPLHIGDPDFTLPERIRTAIAEAIAAGQTHYTSMPGIVELRTAIAAHMASKYGIPCNADHVVCGHGGTQALNACLHFTCDAGCNILMPEIHFPNCLQQAVLANVEPRFYRFDERYQPRLETLEPLVDERTRALLINSPSNPTGAVFPPATVQALLDFAREHGLWLISDEAYIDYVHEGQYTSPLELDWQLPEHERRVLAVLSFSKSYASTGLRMGWTVAPSEAQAAKLGLINEPQTGSLVTPLQWGMIAALEEDDTADRRRLVNQRRLLAHQILTEEGIEYVPSAGGMFICLDIQATGMTGDEFATALIEQERVAVVPCSGFGYEPKTGKDGQVVFEPNDVARRCVRICYAVTEEELREGLRRLARFYLQHSQGAGAEPQLSETLDT